MNSVRVMENSSKRRSSFSKFDCNSRNAEVFVERVIRIVACPVSRSESFFYLWGTLKDKVCVNNSH
jgi:hypothetical protein